MIIFLIYILIWVMLYEPKILSIFLPFNKTIILFHSLGTINCYTRSREYTRLSVGLVWSLVSSRVQLLQFWEFHYWVCENFWINSTKLVSSYVFKKYLHNIIMKCQKYWVYMFEKAKKSWKYSRKIKNNSKENKKIIQIFSIQNFDEMR